MMTVYFPAKRSARRWLELTFYIKYFSKFFTYLVFLFCRSIIPRILKNYQGVFIFRWFNLILLKVEFNMKTIFNTVVLTILWKYIQLYTQTYKTFNLKLYQAYFVLRTWQPWNFAAGKWRHRRINCKQHHLIISSWNCSMFPMEYVFGIRWHVLVCSKCIAVLEKRKTSDFP